MNKPLLSILGIALAITGCSVKNDPAVTTELANNGQPAPLTQPGVCLTFDDRNLDDWEAMLPIFDKYNAHVTFFVCGNIDEAMAARLKAIEAHGHAIGAHGKLHDNYHKCVTEKGMTPEEYANADSLGQMEDFRKYGINVTSYGCPMSSRDDKLDAILKPHFRHIRTGIFPKDGQSWAEVDNAFVPIADVANHFYFNGKGIDKYPPNTQEQIDGAMARAAARKELVVFYAHRIAPDPAKGHHIEPVEVERILQKGQELGLRFYSFNELP